jgi:hypothetical protein
VWSRRSLCSVEDVALRPPDVPASGRPRWPASWRGSAARASAPPASSRSGTRERCSERQSRRSRMSVGGWAIGRVVASGIRAGTYDAAHGISVLVAARCSAERAAADAGERAPGPGSWDRSRHVRRPSAGWEGSARRRRWRWARLLRLVLRHEDEARSPSPVPLAVGRPVRGPAGLQENTRTPALLHSLPLGAGDDHQVAGHGLRRWPHKIRDRLLHVATADAEAAVAGQARVEQ